MSYVQNLICREIASEKKYLEQKNSTQLDFIYFISAFA